MFYNLITSIIAIVAAPLIGVLLMGLDRVITGRFQNKFSGNILQPLYDILKLLGKRKKAENCYQSVLVIISLFAAIMALIVLVLRENLFFLIIIFTLSDLLIVIESMRINSPYSKIGAQRELLQISAYLPVLLLLCTGVFITNKSLMIEEIINSRLPLIYFLPLMFLALIPVLLVKMRKSPFDFSASPSIHQEINGGLYTEFAGFKLALVKLIELYKVIIILSILVLFYASPLWIGLAVALVSYIVVIIIDNITPRLTTKHMLKLMWGVAIGAEITNIIWISIK